MKNLVVVAALLMSPLAFAFDEYDAPDENQWAIAMVESACKIDLDVDAVTGTITETNDGVIYRVYNRNNKVIAAAKAASTFILAKKVCTLK